MIEKTLVLIKPDGVQRGLIGKIIQKFEDTGLKIVGMKMVWADEEFAKKHYTEDLAKRRGEAVRKYNTDFIKSGPVVAFVLEGVHAIENVRKIVGSTEPKSAQPGTIRGDFAHVSYDHCDNKKQVVKNTIHASADKKDAEYEVSLWFKKDELHTYKTVHDMHIY
ncbi:MAG: nucleoside-diphosphate kinase [Nanoarchaeota archaeon]|nr:nucleoside-diphosphate kinase [Nanoarchaeota archaeon]MBU1322212.1 nucleoside-diphosphate kinase [Nanoarchaeota archaeon]MBU1597753.1 nucleoside-diphosphate kinase [Nanoarchaeota archaeon]MBU2442017.1 nucleoside-diphosphate kinase [Nanoarchaeota archaeon]